MNSNALCDRIFELGGSCWGRSELPSGYPCRRIEARNVSEFPTSGVPLGARKLVWNVGRHDGKIVHRRIYAFTLTGHGEVRLPDPFTTMKEAVNWLFRESADIWEVDGWGDSPRLASALFDVDMKSVMGIFELWERVSEAGGRWGYRGAGGDARQCKVHVADDELGLMEGFLRGEVPAPVLLDWLWEKAGL